MIRLPRTVSAPRPLQFWKAMERPEKVARRHHNLRVWGTGAVAVLCLQSPVNRLKPWDWLQCPEKVFKKRMAKDTAKGNNPVRTCRDGWSQKPLKQVPVRLPPRGWALTARGSASWPEPTRGPCRGLMHQVQRIAFKNHFAEQ